MTEVEPPEEVQQRLRGQLDVLLARQLAKVAVRTIYAAIVRDEALLAEVRKYHKETAEFQRLTAAPVPPEVREWVKANFWNPGVLRDAVESELLIAVRSAKAERPPEGYRQVALWMRYDTVPTRLLDHKDPDYHPEVIINPDGPRARPTLNFHLCMPWCVTP